MTSSSADHWALAVDSRKIRPATAPLKSPGKPSTCNQREVQDSQRGGADAEGGGSLGRLDGSVLNLVLDG